MQQQVNKQKQTTPQQTDRNIISDKDFEEFDQSLKVVADTKNNENYKHLKETLKLFMKQKESLTFDKFNTMIFNIRKVISNTTFQQIKCISKFLLKLIQVQQSMQKIWFPPQLLQKVEENRVKTEEKQFQSVGLQQLFQSNQQEIEQKLLDFEQEIKSKAPQIEQLQVQIEELKQECNNSKYQSLSEQKYFSQSISQQHKLFNILQHQIEQNNNQQPQQNEQKTDQQQDFEMHLQIFQNTISKFNEKLPEQSEQNNEILRIVNDTIRLQEIQNQIQENIKNNILNQKVIDNTNYEIEFDKKLNDLIQQHQDNIKQIEIQINIIDRIKEQNNKLEQEINIKKQRIEELNRRKEDIKNQFEELQKSQNNLQENTEQSQQYKNENEQEQQQLKQEFEEQISNIEIELNQSQQFIQSLQECQQQFNSFQNILFEKSQSFIQLLNLYQFIQKINQIFITKKDEYIKLQQTIINSLQYQLDKINQTETLQKSDFLQIYNEVKHMFKDYL